MGFIIRCPHKGCKSKDRDIEPELDKASGIVYCTCEDEKEIDNLTEFAKRQMISLGQIRRKTVEQESFSVKCQSCEKQGAPKMKKSKPFCKFCNKEITNLSASFVNMMKQTK